MADSFSFPPAGSQEPFTPTGTLSATSVQAAIAEAAAEALQLTGGTLTGTATIAGVVFSDNVTFAAGTKIGLYGATPIVQPVRANQLVDSSGGSTNSNTVAVIAGAVDPTAALKTSVANGFATVIARINAIETILHNTGLEA